jgi:hypothetical protein
MDRGPKPGLVVRISVRVNPPYLPTTHTWRCISGHEIVLCDHGWPQRPGFKESILRAWIKYKHGDELRCPQCGGKATYTSEFANANAPPPMPIKPMMVPPPAAPSEDFQHFGREFYAIPCTPGGAVAARRDAGRRRR